MIMGCATYSKGLLVPLPGCPDPTDQTLSGSQLDEEPVASTPPTPDPSPVNDTAAVSRALARNGSKERDWESDIAPRVPQDISIIHEAAAATMAEPDAFAWVGLYDPTPVELQAVGEAFSIHPLALADAGAQQERPKMDVGSASLTVVMHPARYEQEREIVHFGQLTVLLAPHYVIAVRYGDTMRPVDIRDAMESDPAWLSQGPGSVLHAMFTKVVESYGPVIDGITDDIEEVEEDVFSDDRKSPTQRIYELKREVIQFSKASGPLVTVLKDLSVLDHPLITHELQKYFSDIGDEVRRIADLTMSQRELLTSALEANMTQVSLKQNEDMRRISAWGAIIAVPTLVSGVYGMNFEHMPELGTRYGYFLVIGVMLGVSAALYVYFKKIGWL